MCSVFKSTLSIICEVLLFAKQTQSHTIFIPVSRVVVGALDVVSLSHKATSDGIKNLFIFSHFTGCKFNFKWQFSH